MAKPRQKDLNRLAFLEGRRDILRKGGGPMKRGPFRAWIRAMTDLDMQIRRMKTDLGIFGG